MAPKSTKEKTKGQKQIVQENKETLNFYSYIIAGVSVVYFLVQVLIFWSSFTALPIVLSCGASLTYFAAYRFMSSMATATYSAEGSLIDGGTDLNMVSGMGEHAKDLILLTAVVQSLSLISNYFWLLWLLVPIRAFYMLWVNFLGPWFFAPGEEDNISDKKQKKMDRKMRRVQR
ncbi:hypothetical protein LOTGIDRAFT_195390 [Lottia gigantea]|uniref:Transmembrane protein 208 n=1 Tax=Lottia gigantea TaxID=225164 RepID=V3ZTV0_LOTGI|nr:hypothetical protein LOTGIDRAFT_195390 [Lottia gigantea]ESO85990.1 hypothetical protein LOTGIDRAFT_195390 [Lottia gigantea]